ncbi:MAG TPA: AAA family ATPase [Myxococcales bacterium]|nr:AAA family ATPase [Myxococcales bacterium]HAN30534.1 AAA family ATPase [Myxococcales bacterium]
MEKPQSHPPIEDRLAWVQSQIDRLTGAISEVIVGQKEVVEGTLIGLFTGGHILLEGVPGVGKTLLVRTLSDALDLSFSRVQFTPDLMPTDIVGTHILNVSDEGERVFSFRPGPVFTHILLADEVNRATPKTQSALLEAMAEQRVTVGTETHSLQAPFFVMATQNPLEMEGTYPLPEAQLDRFMFKLQVPFPSRADLHTIVERTVAPEVVSVQPVMTGADILEIRRLALGCPCAHHVTDLAIRLVEATHGGATTAQKYLRAGASPRAVQALVVGSKMRAIFDGRANVSTEDIRALTPAVLSHRVLLNFDAEADGVTPHQVIDALLKEIPDDSKSTM